MEKQTAVTDYLATLEGAAKEWNAYFIHYMRTNYSELEEVISFQMPTYKLGTGKDRSYIAFGVGKNHFSLHALDFALIASLKEQLSKPGKGKGCVNVPFDKVEEREILKQAIDTIVARKKAKDENKGEA